MHARALPVCFDTDRDIPLHGFRRGLNARLADDLFEHGRAFIAQIRCWR